MGKLAQNIAGKTIVLGVTGSIAAYKAAELTSLLVKAEADVHVVMTEAATRLVGAQTFLTLSRNPVGVDLWEAEKGWQPGHIELADKADLLVIAPATANTIAQMAHGLAPDLLLSIYLATPAPVLIAPAMNGKMLHHPATVSNIQVLRERGHSFVDPAAGMLACGYEGDGKLAEVTHIFDAIVHQLSQDS